MGKIRGIGGIFFKCDDHKATMDWYEHVLGLDVRDETAFILKGSGPGPGYQVLGYFDGDDDYFAPSDENFMLNLSVDDLEGFVSDLRGRGVDIIGGISCFDQGKFAWILDPDGRKIELWEPVGE